MSDTLVYKFYDGIIQDTLSQKLLAFQIRCHRSSSSNGWMCYLSCLMQGKVSSGKWHSLDPGVKRRVEII